MIKEIKLKFGSTPQSATLTIKISAVTIFIGPNNSGKSKVLTEISDFCNSGNTTTHFKIVEDIVLSDIDPEKVNDEIEAHTLTPLPSENLYQGRIIFGDGRRRNQLPREQIIQVLKAPNINKESYCRYYLSFKTLKLDGLNRISLIQDQQLGDLQQAPQNNLAILFNDDEKRLEVRRIIYEAFENYFVLDPTYSGQVRIRLSKTPPENHQLERGLHREAVNFHKEALSINEASDGVKAFTGIITSVIAGRPNITIIDEPEAFLHPSLSFKLGKEIANNAKKGNNKLFVATHSSNFLMGCIQSGSFVNIVRLTYSNEVSTARVLDKEKISQLMKDPLLRSTGVLDALFYEFVIVTEGDSDRAFYQEINERLNQFDSKRGISNCLFLNAQGKDTIWKIVKPLREMGIPAAGIYDIDILKNEGNNWTNALKAGFIPELSHQSLGQSRSQIKKKFDEKGKDMKKDGGVNALEESDKEACNNLFDQLDQYGLFVVRHGEVEKWLQYLGVEAHKSVWLPQVFEKMGSTPETENYVKPQEGDVWDFMYKIKMWMLDKNRKGIPS